jgi:Xaa-Pro aminopeptidase
MATVTTGSVPMTAPPFSNEEYQRRQSAVLARMESEGVDALAVTAYSHQEYLSGYDGSGGYFAPFPLILAPGRAPTYVAREYDVDAVRTESCITEVVGYTQEGDQAKAVADVLRGFGLQRGRIGLELGCWNLAPRDVYRLEAELPDLKIVDATRLVSSVAAVKSEVEIDAMRTSMRFTCLAVETMNNSLREGVTEDEVAHAIDSAVEAAGGKMRPYTLLFGPRTALPHGAPTSYALQRNQPVFTEIGAWCKGYAAGICRSAVLGSHPGAESLHTLAEEALQAAIASIRPGVTTGDVDAACRGVIERAGRSEVFRHRTGYQTGIMWSDRGNLSLEPNSQDVLEPNMTFHMPVILFQEGEYGVGVSENILVTENGCEILSGLPQTIHRVA